MCNCTNKIKDQGFKELKDFINSSKGLTSGSKNDRINKIHNPKLNHLNGRARPKYPMKQTIYGYFLVNAARTFLATFYTSAIRSSTCKK